MADTYEPTPDSLDEHETPAWYHDAKLGIFIHWGVYSVPAWANPESDHAYAEWYPYYMYVEGSETWEYHRENYGADVEYAEFIEDWRAENWDPDEWADFFADVGARYVVLTGEHHDGFPLWPTHYTKYNAGEMGPERDLVGELGNAVRERELKFGASYHANLNYYQPGFEGPFGHPDYEGSTPFEDADPGPEYVDFMDAKHRELIRRYEPDILWFDTPQADTEQLRANELIADYYNRAEEWGKEVLVNDRASTDHDALAGHEQDEEGAFGGDFATPEYTSFDEIKPFKWETCRGIGRSFGYNRAEEEGHHLTGEELIHLLVDVVSKNGNLLINVGPRADGTIPDLQRGPLEALGEWLAVNGEAIYGTRPWAIADDPESDVEVRYTWKDEDLYATCLSWPNERASLAPGDRVDPDGIERISILGAEGSLAWTSDGDTLLVDAPEDPPTEHAHAFRIEGVSNPRA